MARDPELLAHQQWLGYLQPVGLVVSPPALLQAQAHVNANIVAEHQRFLGHVTEALLVGRPEPLPAIKNLRALLLDIFNWQTSDLVEAGDPRMAALEVVLPEYHDTLRPTCAVPDDPRANPPTWLLLIQELAVGMPLDEVGTGDDRRWQATAHARFERLLRETQIPIGLLANGTHLRLVYAPRGETAGHLTFPVQAMMEVAGRPIFSALHMLLSAERLFSLPDKQRLPAILAESRKYQNTVSTELAKQVLAALYELLRGFQAADDLRKGEVLRAVLERDPDQVYAGLLTVLLRLVFLLYAEDRGLMSDDEVYVKHYSVTGLFERLRADAGRYPDTMDLRYGAWGQLVALFRMVHDGGRHGMLHLPARHGYLFNPDRYPFLESRTPDSQRQRGERLSPPLVADGVIFRALQNLLVLDGERISYRSLDVEQIGSVYETIMGFRLEKAGGRSIAIKPAKAHGAPVTINLEALLQVPAKDRGKWVKEQADQGVTGAALNALKIADTPEALVAALERKVARDLTPNIVPPGGMVLQPSDERRRSGSHYTPRSLTEPIVRKALEPVLKQLGERPSPDKLLGLKVCDPAMGSGAFLVEACRQLGDALVTAWRVHDCLPTIPPDEDEILHARRVVAQRCLYGVDKNPMAVDLAKLSLWLATLAKDHAFTFLDHALRCGDSLVGLSRGQIADFHWKKAPQRVFGQDKIEERIKAATRVRQEILEGGDFVSPLLKSQKLALADESLGLVRFAGNIAIAAFFAADNDRKRQTRRDELLGVMTEYLAGNVAMRPTAAERELRAGPKGITPFHWEVEFPEVFGRTNPGFDCVVGNPPFAGVNSLAETNRAGYTDWLRNQYPETGGKCDLVAFFFRRTYDLLRNPATLGLIATNTIAQGDTRRSGLSQMVRNGANIFSALKRVRWAGQAAVIVSVIHVAKGQLEAPCLLDDKPADHISSYLLDSDFDDEPQPLSASSHLAFLGSKVHGLGFIFDDNNDACPPTSLIEQVLQSSPKSAPFIRPYIGGEELNSLPQIEYPRRVIDFGDMPENEARRHPNLIRIVEEYVRPQRMASNGPERSRWWQHGRRAADLYKAIRDLRRILVVARNSESLAFTFLPADGVINDKIIGFSTDRMSTFCVLQSRTHEIWARFFSSTLKDDLQYTPTDCLVTFPFPDSSASAISLEQIGEEYHEFRASLMVRNNEGLTKTYNHFHDPNARSPDILRLRELHSAMDRAVLDAYCWTDLKATCDFLLDYEEDEDEEETGGRQRKKPWRYRWPDDFRDEVLARLLELNKRRAEQEALAGATAKQPRASGRRKTVSKDNSPGLFSSPE